MKVTAVSHGAATIVCAFATGRGGAFGISLETKASVRLNNTGAINAKIKGFPRESTLLLESCARRVLDYFKLEDGLSIETESNIPVATGLKSSSTAANAAVLAVAGALTEEYGSVGKRGFTVNGISADDFKLVNLGVDAAFDAKVTVTGAFDDAVASFFGGYALTDNRKRRILKRGRMGNLNVVVFVPERRTYSGGVDIRRVKLLEKQAALAWDTAFMGDFRAAITLNGLVHSAVFRENTEVMLSALEAGALASGLSGTGPAVVALVDDKIDDVTDAWSGFEGRIIKTRVNNSKARIL